MSEITVVLNTLLYDWEVAIITKQFIKSTIIDGPIDQREAHNHRPRPTFFESFIFPDAISMQRATLKSLTFIKNYLSNHTGVLNLHEPPLTKSCTNIKQFLKQPLQLS